MLGALFGTISGFCVVYVFKLKRLKEMITEEKVDGNSEWVALELKSIHTFLRVGVPVVCLFILGYGFLSIAARGDVNVAAVWMWVKIAGGSLAAISIVGLFISAIAGSKAKYLRQETGVVEPHFLSTGIKTGLFCLGWFVFSLLLLLVSLPSFIRR